MGHTKHHAIIVTSWSHDHIVNAHAKAEEIFSWVSPIPPPSMNGYRSFMIPPDGSKEGWPESDAGDSLRAQFLDWCDSHAYGDGSNSIVFVEVAFGDESGEEADTVTRSNLATEEPAL